MFRLHSKHQKIIYKYTIIIAYSKSDSENYYSVDIISYPFYGTICAYINSFSNSGNIIQSLLFKAYFY